jgi:hypothetical protein
MAVCPDCGTQNPDGNVRCIKCAAYLSGALEPISQADDGDLESGAKGTRRRWRKDWSFLFTTTTVDWRNKDQFVVSHYTSPYINSERITTFGRLSWFALNTFGILIFAGIAIALLVAWTQSGLDEQLCGSMIFILLGALVASIFVWVTFVPPRD